MSVQIAVIDDWQDVARGAVDWSTLEAIGQVHFCTTILPTPPRWSNACRALR